MVYIRRVFHCFYILIYIYIYVCMYVYKYKYIYISHTYIYIYIVLLEFAWFIAAFATWFWDLRIHASAWLPLQQLRFFALSAFAISATLIGFVIGCEFAWDDNWLVQQNHMKGLKKSPQQSNTIKYFGKFWLQYAAIPCNSMFFLFKGLNLLAMRALGRRGYACAPENLSTSLRCRLGQIVPFKTKNMFNPFQSQ